MGWLNFGGKKRDRAQGFGDSSKTKSRKRPKSFILEKIVTPSAGFGDWEHEFDQLHQLLGSLSLSDLHLPNFFADGGVCPIDPDAPTNNLPPLIDFDPLGLYHDGIATQTPYNPGGAFETLPIALIPVDPQSPNPSNPNAIRQLLNFPLASQPLLGSIDTGVSADSPYLNYANIKKGRDYVGGDDNPLLKAGEGSEHGTFMLGIIDAINKTAPKWVGRAIDSGRWADSLVEFVDAAKASGQKNAIANLSLDLTQKNADGSVTTRYELTPAERSAIEYARQNGVMLVVAAGNDGGVMSVLGQASQEFDNIFTVGAGDINGRSNYSSYGRGLDILADGGTNEHPALSTVGNDLGTMAGTSVATAKVAGAASLVWAANPALNYRQVMEILKSTARDLGPSGWDDETGFGFLNTLAAVDLAKKTKPEVYNPIDFGTPTTWGGEGKVTPMERAVNFKYPITNEPFGGTVAPIGDPYYGVSYRRSPQYSDKWGPGIAAPSSTPLNFDAWTWGDVGQDFWKGNDDALWYRVANTDYWVPSVYIDGYPLSGPSLLPPNPSPSPSPDPSPSPISTFSQTVGDVGYVHDLGFLRVRNGPGTDASGYQQVGTVSPGNTLTFDGETQGESVYDPALGESTTWYHLADGSGWVSGLYMGAASTPTPSPSPSPTQPSATDNVRQMFSDAARQYPQVGAALTGMQDQGGGVFRQEFERAIMIWNGQQVTVYETKGRSVSPTSPSSTPTPVSGKGNTIRTGAADPNYIQQLQKEISDIQNEIKKQTARINESKNFIDVLDKEKTDLSSLITTKEDRIKKIQEDWFWRFNSDKRQEISELDEIIKQAKSQQKWDQENIDYWNSQKTDAELQANQKRTELQQKEIELQKLTFTGTVKYDDPPVRNMPTDVGNSRLKVVFKKGEKLTFGGWTVDNTGRKWFSIVDSEERWIAEQNIELNGTLPESLKIQPHTSSENNSLKIDWDFISVQEGGRRLTGYVPQLKIKHQSGVTIATGFDLGQHNKQELQNMELPNNIIQKLEPYLDLKLIDAENALEKQGLTITEEEGKIIDKAVKKKQQEKVEKSYNNDSKINFRDLPGEAQTVIASVAFQKGDLSIVWKKFWSAVTQQNWSEAVKVLQNAKDGYTNRRNAEANYLKPLSS
ncbi:MAG: pesticin C-terminus-like muramidase [Tychonema bourrellyi B0820]|uniref:pesticin C-terminus-like muramidase n=1 Tax=Tychonema bourrellyi TaxID=54313 RepID=UPI0015D49C99|nr:pesticin C-terminus-like muramidase [Tychonema bourrellyi]MDQ2096678.1 pesticin C-terminus-like muramidase [Tychonema bourrellyi B0820]